MKLVIYLLPLFLGLCACSELTRGNNLFATTLYKTLAKEDKNEAFSPLSLHTVLALAYQGSAGVTENRLRTVLTLPSKSHTAASYNSLLSKLNKKSNVTFNVANKIYAMTGRTFTKSFRNTAARFLSETASIDFSKPGTAAEINDWVNKKTNGKIPTLVTDDAFDGSTRTILLNALYFKGKWDKEFKAEATKTTPFYVNEGETVNCPMMHQVHIFDYAANDLLDAQLLKLVFRDKRFSLVVILPNSKTGITRLEQSLKNVDVDELTNRFSAAAVDVYLPRFKVESSHELRDALSKVGLAQIFDVSAEFPNILNGESLVIDQVYHKTTIEINEEGGEASAATGAVAVAVTLPLTDHTFIADHPFIFLLTADMDKDDLGYDKGPVIVLMGKVTKPEEAVKG